MSTKLYSHLPTKPGIYLFIDVNDQVLYIGKAINLKSRVRNHFTTKSKPRLLAQVKKIKHITTTSEIESLLLEAKLIKEYLPKFNVQLKDDKRYLCVGITKEKYPRLKLLRQVEKTDNLLDWFGPFPSSSSLKEVLRLLRRIFPYCSCKKRQDKPCFYYHLNLCPAPHLSELLPRDSKHLGGGRMASCEVEYLKTIKKIRLFLNGQISLLVRDLTRQMKKAARKEKFEEAAESKRQIQMIQALLGKFKKTGDGEEIGKGLEKLRKLLVRWSGIDPMVINRLEAYDVANLGQKIIVGSMVVFTNGEPDTSQYRQFKIITPNRGDPGAIKQVIARRLNHPDWVYPQVVLVDGGKAQISAAHAALKEKNLANNIAILGLTKKQETIIVPLIDKGKIMGWKQINYSARNPALKLLQHARDESHRFAQRYYHKLSSLV